jgi:predicted alpha/beta hydrolase family esterase
LLTGFLKIGDAILSKVIIGIHGLDNKPPEWLLRTWWLQAIREGLKNIGQFHFLFRFRFVYWAHLLYSQPLDPAIKDKRHPLYVQYPYVKSPGKQQKKQSFLRQKILDYIEKQMDHLFLNPDMTINFSGVTDLIIKHYFRDLSLYYSDATIIIGNEQILVRKALRSQLAQTLRKFRNDDILLIAHSMGSIIAYDTLVHEAPDVPIDTLVTIGSPLSLPIIVSRIVKEFHETGRNVSKPPTPENVKRWYNLADLRDKVTLNYNLADDYLPNLRGVFPEDEIVYNDYEYDGEKNPHKSFGYLRTPELARHVHEFLSRDVPKYKL